MAISLTFAVPVNWDSTKTYEQNMIVFVGKKAYTAIQDVPTGIEITNTEYWTETGVPSADLPAIQNKLNELDSEVTNNTEDITQAQADIMTNANNITSLTNTLATLQESVYELDSEVTDNTEDITQAQADIMTNANNITSLTNTLATLQESVSHDYQTFLVSNTLSLFCVGNTVCLSGYIENATYSTGDTIAVIPSEYRPKYNLPSVLVRVNGSISIVAIEGSGAVKIYTNVSGGRIDICASWGIQ